MGPRYVNKRNEQGAPSAEEIGMNFGAKAGITGTDAAALKALRALPAEKVVDGLGLMSMGKAGDTHSGPMIDGEIVRESPAQALVAGRWAKVPVMIGANNADIGFPSGRTMDELFAPFGANAEKAKAAFNPEKSDNVWLVGWKIAADQTMVEPARFVARTIAAAGVPSYEYRFSYVAESLRAKMPGAFHATEIPYVFDTVRVNLGDKITENDARAARQAHAYWVNFAKTGDPTGEGLPKWPTYDAKKDVLMDFTNSGPVAGPDPRRDRLDLVEGLATK
jgi:para-nitrobenzyl esterase